jgi:hypothetical protein
MEESRIKSGKYVTISNNISKTDMAYGTNSNMSKMKGRTYKIEKSRSTKRGTAAIIKGYIWHRDDLTEQSLTYKPEPFHFNIEELNI